MDFVSPYFVLVFTFVAASAILAPTIFTWTLKVSKLQSSIRVRRTEFEILLKVFKESYNLVKDGIGVSKHVIDTFDMCTGKAEEVLKIFLKFGIDYDRDSQRLQDHDIGASSDWLVRLWHKEFLY